MSHLLRVKCRALATDAADPKFAADILRHATTGMHRVAADHGRHLVEEPRLSEISGPNPLGLVELTFSADADDD